jgi:hypothetical protein
MAGPGVGHCATLPDMRITGPEAATRYGVPRSTLRNWTGGGRLTVHGYTRRRAALLDTAEIEALLRERDNNSAVRAARPRCPRSECRRILPTGATRCVHCGHDSVSE